MDTSALSDSLHPLESKVLAALREHQTPSSQSLNEEEIAQATGLEVAQVSMAIGWLQAKGLIAEERQTSTEMASLTKIGERQFEKYSPIERILSAARDAGKTGKRLTIQDIQASEGLEPSEMSGAIGCLKKEGAVRIVAGGNLEATGAPSATAESIRTGLRDLRGTTRKLDSFPEPVRQVIRQHAVKRGNAQEPFRIDERIERWYGLTPEGRTVAGGLAEHGDREEVSQLTPELLKDGAWRTKRFRKYTISLRPPRAAAGKRHPYREFLDLVKYKLVSMGFKEMRGPLVETEFWNMDALYMPQFHPARAIHDVYFVKEPTHAHEIAEPFLSRVASVHENGGDTGSTGWGYQYDLDRARRLVLRSQGTAVSARTLASGPLVPGKYFSLARCFRYDQVDATHATDFFQVEGIILGRDITFRTLLGLLDLFAREMAQAKESRFLPAYFPFTEPSVELHVRHPRLGWIELGGAGLFRPEVTRPLGVDVPVIAWGLGLDRMAMVALGVHDIRDLFSTDLEMIRTTRAHF
ncbi:MAG TPA: phenylalanine--tRNA ligase subunit alpha [Nitrospiraceae bacterium]|nr:phenylalanine--tRNA ligase subunit alpha [Nitrospiraceae bacterium]